MRLMPLSQFLLTSLLSLVACRFDLPEPEPEPEPEPKGLHFAYVVSQASVPTSNQQAVEFSMGITVSAVRATIR